MILTRKIMKILKSKFMIWIIIIFLLLLLLNLYLMQQGSYSPQQIHYVILHLFTLPQKVANDFITTGEIKIIQEKIWSILATFTGAIGLSIAGLITQALTKNPLADASTLGMSQSGIFGVILAFSFGLSFYYVKFMFALIFGVVSAGLLFMIITFSKSKTSVNSGKIILTGLALGIIFKTLTFLVRRSDKFINLVSYNYVLGGSESVNSVIGNNQFIILLISIILVFFALFLTLLIARNLTLLELGDEQAKNLGIKVGRTKTLALLIAGIAVPAAIMVIGNVAFIGLFSIHLARFFGRTRNYKKILVLSFFISATLGFLALFFTQYMPKINSGLWMTFIGAPYLIYAGIKGLK